MKKQWSFGMLLISFIAHFLTENASGAAVDYRTGVIDPRVTQVPREIQDGIFRDPGKHLPPLVKFLVDDARDDCHKVKRLHDWIADNIEYDVESYFAGTTSGSSEENSLVRRRAVCHGYGNLLERMCKEAGIPCRTITGNGRGYGFSQGQEIVDGQQNHAWNAVHVEGAWRLVDVTWDAGHVEGREFRKEYCTTYLFMPPEQFVYTHLPGEARWQLLTRPLTSQQFKDLPYLRGVFFDHGLQLGTSLKRVTPIGSSVKFKLYTSRPVEMMAKLLTADGNELPGRTLEQTGDGVQSILAAFPTPGRYQVKLYCRQLNDSKLMDVIATLDFQASVGISKTFPTAFAHFGKLQGRLDSPLFVPLPTGTPIPFQVRLNGAHDVRLAVGDEQPWRRLQPDPQSPNVYRIETTIPAGVRVRINAKLAPQDKSYATLIEFSPPVEANDGG